MKMKVIAVIGVLAVGVALVYGQSKPSDSTAEIVKALNIHNQQLARIATSLERISGQQPGWKLP